MEILINVPEWIAYILVIWLAISTADNTLILVQKYLDWRIKKLRDKKRELEDKADNTK